MKILDMQIRDGMAVIEFEMPEGAVKPNPSRDAVMNYVQRLKNQPDQKHGLALTCGPDTPAWRRDATRLHLKIEAEQQGVDPGAYIDLRGMPRRAILRKLERELPKHRAVVIEVYREHAADVSQLVEGAGTATH